MKKTLDIRSAAVMVLSACAMHATALADPDWRREAIVSIGQATDFPSYADRHCLAPAADSAPEALLLYFRLGRARYYQAFPTAPGEGWKVGDKVLFDSQTCEIRRL